MIPCDAVILKTTDMNNKAFLETKSLDGETNLKIRLGLESFQQKNIDEKILSSKDKFEIERNEANVFLEKF